MFVAWRCGGGGGGGGAYMSVPWRGEEACMFISWRSHGPCMSLPWRGEETCMFISWRGWVLVCLFLGVVRGRLCIFCSLIPTN